MGRALMSVCLALVAATASASFCRATPLDQVLALVPEELTEGMVQFTEWSQIKGRIALGFLTSDGPLASRMKLVRRASQDQAAASAYGLSRIRDHAETWGWDTADLDWEANLVSRELPPTYVLKLRDGFDFSVVAGHFASRGFVQTGSHGAVIYYHDFDPVADWTRTTELSILTTAYIEDEKLMILSSFRGAVDVLLTTRAGELVALAEDTFVHGAVEHLGDPFSAVVLRGIGECLRFTPNPVLDLIGTLPTEERVDQLKTMLEQTELLVPYRALAVGYRYEEGRPAGTVVFEYDSPELATMDLPARRTLAEEGISD